MKSLTKTKTYNATPEQVCKYPDDLGVTGIHMMQPSMTMMMMGEQADADKKPAWLYEAITKSITN